MAPQAHYIAIQFFFVVASAMVLDPQQLQDRRSPQSPPPPQQIIRAQISSTASLATSQESSGASSSMSQKLAMAAAAEAAKDVLARQRYQTIPLPQPRLYKSPEELLKLPIRASMVRFSAEKPLLPKPKAGHGDQRSKRGNAWHSNHIQMHEVQDVCPAQSDWVKEEYAEDPYGNRVAIVQHIPVNGTIVNQYFFETYCAPQYVYEVDYFFGTTYRRNLEPTCKGIDESTWHSRCRNNSIWTYGKVLTKDGELGWSVIAIPGGCGCTIWPKRIVDMDFMRKPILNDGVYDPAKISDELQEPMIDHQMSDEFDEDLGLETNSVIAESSSSSSSTTSNAKVAYQNRRNKDPFLR